MFLMSIGWKYPIVKLYFWEGAGEIEHHSCLGT